MISDKGKHMGKGTQTLKPGIFIGIVLFVVGIFFFFRWMSVSAEADNFKENAEETIAYVSYVEKYRAGKKRYRRHERRVYVSYAADRKHYQEILKGSTEDMRELDVFSVQYDPDDPSDVRTIDYTGGSEQYSLIAVVCIVSGAVVAVVSCITGRKEHEFVPVSDFDAEKETDGASSAHDFR